MERWGTPLAVAGFVAVVAAAVVLLGAFDDWRTVDAPVGELPIRMLDGPPPDFDAGPWLVNVWLPG